MSDVEDATRDMSEPAEFEQGPNDPATSNEGKQACSAWRNYAYVHPLRACGGFDRIALYLQREVNQPSHLHMTGWLELNDDMEVVHCAEHEFAII